MQAHTTRQSSYGKQLSSSSSPSTNNNASMTGQHQEQTLETSIGIHMWYPFQTAASTSTLSKTPVLREVPQMKRRLTTRLDRDMAASMVTDTKTFQSLKSAAPSWLREKPSRQKLNTQLKPLPHSRGSWKKVTAICRDTGFLLIYGEDRAMVHSISIKELSASSIRMVDDSLFSFPNVLGIFCRPSPLQFGTRSPVLGSGDKSSSAQDTSRNQPIYLCFPTRNKVKKWRGLLRTFAKPEIYGPAQKGGSHRCHRQIEMKVLEAKLVAERRLATSISTGALAASLDDSEQADVTTSALGLHKSADALGKKDADESIIDQKSRMVLQHSLTTTSIVTMSKEGAQATPTEGEEDVNDDSSDVGMTSGPISGLSGRQRILESGPTAGAFTSYEMERKVSDGNIAVPSACYCLVWMADEVVAQTKMCNSSFKSMTWFDKFSLKDLASLTSIQIDLMQSGRHGKVGILGSVTIPVETMRRGEAIEGWFPIWATRSRDSESASSFPVESFYTDEVVGEIKIAINVAEETVLPLKKYTQVEEALTSNGHLELIRLLCKHLDEDQVISHLVDIYASRGAIVEHLRELTEAESANFGDNPALLFRSNTLLTRAIDKYQRLYCRDWLDACIGSTVRRVCENQIFLEASDSPHHYINPLAIQDLSSSPTTITVESNLDALLRLCKELWANIYINRHRCPPDLQRVLCYIRTKVNSSFPHSDTHAGPGIQGVGAFVFLRLICPAITTPHLYGLMGTSPTAASSKTLMLIAKVFLALANKRVAFDKDKEPWLGQANDFLTSQAAAYDDFITYVSTNPSDNETNVKTPLGDEADYQFQRQIKTLVKGLPMMHRESLPSQEYMLDRPLTLAEMVSFVVREANIEIPVDGQHRNGEKDNLDRYHRFIDLCCDIEDKTGVYLDRAGYNPNPIDFSKVYAKDNLGVQSPTQVYTSLHSPPIADNAALSHPDPPPSLRNRRATVTGIKSLDDNATVTSPPALVGEDVRPQHRLPMIFAPHLKPTSPGRLSMDSEDDGKRPSLGRMARGRSSIEEVGRKISGFADYQELTPELAPSGFHKLKQRWFKGL